jgi:hypothetical protein
MRNKKEVKKQVRGLDGIDAEDGYHQGGMRNGVTVKQKKSVTQEHNMWALENSVIHVGRAVQSMWMTYFSDLSTWMTEFSVTVML